MSNNLKIIRVAKLYTVIGRGATIKHNNNNNHTHNILTWMKFVSKYAKIESEYDRAKNYRQYVMGLILDTVRKPNFILDTVGKP